MSDYEIARKRVKEKKSFYRHLTTFITMGTFFFLLNIFTDPFDWWWFFPLMPWGVGIAMHYFKVFGLPGTEGYSEAWEQREIEREMERMNRRGSRRGRRRFREDYGRRNESTPVLPAAEPDEEYFDLHEPRETREPTPRHQRRGWNEDDLV